MKITPFLLPFFLIISTVTVYSEPVITFFFKPAPDVHKIAQKLSRPGKLAKHTLHSFTNHLSLAGICALYAGYVTVSDEAGEITFPRKTIPSSIVMVITPEIKPVALFENTISHWEIIPGTPTALYTVTQRYDTEKNADYWVTEKLSSLPDNKLPANSITILAKPTNIDIPLGKQQTNFTANLVLPSIYLKKNVNVASYSTYLLTIRHLFKPVGSKISVIPFKIRTHVTS